jgi:ABC-type sugar transport system substrate-binding protein
VGHKNKSIIAGTFIGRFTLLLSPMLDGRQPGDIMKKILLATVAILAFAAPSFAQDKQDKTVGQAPPSGATSFYLAQDTGSMKCQVVNTQPAAGGSLKVIGTAHPTQASAETALTAEKSCAK